MKERLNLRLVTMDDAKIIFDWANDSEVRQNSFNTAAISWSEHITWLEHILEDEHVLFFLLVDNDTPVGQIRLAFKDGKWLISYSIDSVYRGRGYGKMILQLAEDELCLTGHAGEKIYAEVKNGNTASCRIFEKLNYKQTTSEHSGAFAYEKIAGRESI